MPTAPRGNEVGNRYKPYTVLTVHGAHTCIAWMGDMRYLPSYRKAYDWSKRVVVATTLRSVPARYRHF